MQKQLFFNELKAQFNLREPKAQKPTNIYMVVFLDGKQYKLSTGLKVYPEHWNSEKQQAFVSCRLNEIDNINNTIINDKLTELKQTFVDYKLYICTHPDEVINQLYILKKYIYKDMEHKGTKKEPIDIFAHLFDALDKDVNKKGDILATGKNKSTKAQDYSQIKPFKTFIDSTGLVFYSFNDLNREIISNYQEWLINNLQGRTNGGKCSVSTINKNINKLLELINKYAVKRGLMDNSVFTNLQVEKLKDKSASIDNYIALRDDEIYKLWNYKTKTKADDAVKDIFILNCLIGQRIGDIDKIDKNVDKTGDSVYISLVQDKCTHKIETELIFTLAKTILEKYDYKLPTINKGTFNTKLKAIAKDAGITGTETITTHTAGTSEPITEYKERYDCISSHTARRTFVTLLSLREWNYNTIAKYTGHTVEMVELYDKSKGNIKALRLFKELKRNNPELLLKMVDDTQEQPKQQEQQTLNNDDVSAMLALLNDKVNSIMQQNNIQPIKQSLKGKDIQIFNILFFKRGVEIAINMKRIESLGGNMYNIIAEFNYIKGRIVEFIMNETEVQKQAIAKYEPKANSREQIKGMIDMWKELELNLDIIYMYIERADIMGIDTRGLKQYAAR